LPARFVNIQLREKSGKVDYTAAES